VQIEPDDQRILRESMTSERSAIATHALTRGVDALRSAEERDALIPLCREFGKTTSGLRDRRSVAPASDRSD
jgi:hypothetical protein